MSIKDYPVDKLIKAYLLLRNKKEAIVAKVKEEVSGIKEQMAQLENFMQLKADEQGVTQFKTENGTAFLSTVDQALVSDWDKVLEFVAKNEAYELLEKRVSKYAVRDYMKQNKELPPGVSYRTLIKVSVRKPSTKIEGE